MKCLFAPETNAHAPEFFLVRGRVAPNKERAERAQRLLKGLADAGLSVDAPDMPGKAALDAALAAVHTPRFLAFLEHAWRDWQELPDFGPEVIPNIHPIGPAITYPVGLVGRVGWHMSDTGCPVGPDTWAAARAAAGTALAAAQAVVDGAPAAYALCRPPGHHAYADSAGGHCILNNSAAAAAFLRRHHDRVAVLDIDVHHGNGTQGIFWERGDVLTVSVHADPSSFYPFYAGYVGENGAGPGQGANLNIPLPRGSGDQVWLDAIAGALDRVAAFKPGALVLALGLDAHERDPLGGLSVTTPAFGDAARLVAAAGLPTVLVQEGGYLSDDLSANLTSFMGGWPNAAR